MPPETVAWVEDVLGPGHRVVASAPLAGATSSAVHAVTTTDRRGRAHHHVLRRYTARDWLAREPDLAEREAEALTIVEGCAVTTPVLVAADTAGERTDVPALLMTRLPGAPVASPDLTTAGIRLLAQLLPGVHATTVPPGARVRTYRPYGSDGRLEPPAWSRDDRLWERAIAVHGAPPIPVHPVLVHRDFHPGNVLFAHGEDRVTGLVDWVNTSRGAAEVDVGHCRVNLAVLASLNAADRFRDAWLSASGTEAYDPTFDILAVTGGLVPGHQFLDHDHRAVEQLVARALAEIGA